MTGTKIITLAFVVGLVGCNGSQGKDTPLTQQVELCHEVCLGQLCDPLYDPALEGDPSVVCQQFCENSVATADDAACFSEHQDLLECLERLSCSELVSWSEQMPDAMCVVEEEELTQACPDVEVPRDAGS
jgi:hypothetical protein